MATILKRAYGSKDEVPADITLYVEKDGKHVLNPDIEIEGLIPAARLEEFRNKNIEQSKQLEKFKDIDPDKYHDLLSKETDLADANLVKKSEVQMRVEQRLAESQKSWNTTKEKLEKELSEWKARTRKLTIEQQALGLAIPFGLKKDEAAKRSLILLVNDVWSIDDSGEPVAYEGDGKTVRYDSAGNVMRGQDAMKRFIDRLAKEDGKFLFEENQGGGADGAGRGGSRFDDNEVNPFDPKTFNRTKQAQMVQKDFKKAQRMAAKHGVDLQPSSVYA
jgi:hypothetical protein